MEHLSHLLQVFQVRQVLLLSDALYVFGEDANFENIFKARRLFIIKTDSELDTSL